MGRAATSWTLRRDGQPLRETDDPAQDGLELTFEGCDFNFIFDMRLWSLAGAQDGPFSVGGGAGGLVKSLVPIATWLNPHSTTGLAVDASKFLNVQFRGMQQLISGFMAMGMSVEDGVYRVQGMV
jgi:hypothetical protein